VVIGTSVVVEVAVEQGGSVVDEPGNVVPVPIVVVSGTGVVDEVGAVVPVPMVVVSGNVVVVGVPGVVVPVGDVVVVVEPGVGVAEHPKERNKLLKTFATPGKPANATCSDRTSWHVGTRKAEPICATATPSGTACVAPADGWLSSSAVHTASNDSPLRHCGADALLRLLGSMPPSRLCERSHATRRGARRTPRTGTGLGYFRGDVENRWVATTSG
jgi:hypothetical protein